MDYQLENWKLIGAFVIGKTAIVTIQHIITKDILQVCRPQKQLRVNIENGLRNNIIQFVLNKYEGYELMFNET